MYGNHPAIEVASEVASDDIPNTHEDVEANIVVDEVTNTEADEQSPK